jgi:hypothetical protein
MGGIGFEPEGGGSMKKSDSLSASSLGILLSILILFLSSTSGFGAKGKSTMEIPEGSAGMVAYGSLVSLKSMEQTLGHKYEGPIHPVHLMGYERTWTCVRPWVANKIDAYILRDTERVPIIGAAELNIYPKKRGRINCILYRVTDEELAKFDTRERGYRRVDVTDRIEEFDFRGGKVYVYEGLPAPPDGSLPDKGTYILIKEFLDNVTGAFDAIGKDFRDEFDRSTRPCAYPVVPYDKIIWEKAI